MRRFLTIQLCCKSEDIQTIQQKLEKFKIFDISITTDFNEDIERESRSPIKIKKSTSTFVCTSIIENKDEAKHIQYLLKELDVRIERLQIEKIDTLTRSTIYSGLVVASIVFIALLSHNLDEHILEHPIENIGLPFMLAGLGFGLELLIIYRERN